ncbi:hypothetical protein CDLVIII_2232 [Clostridium sp. DL-VIII]|uniref:hypothetical protein n=1 Tax=Clostridium sp. DL-VIII TaxID=641107 RepID=UPI00023AFC20|nr:hypothetical protein [Clostridium sp. DL-VIII]EHI98894.1 hypothetical protein CDLVIII_2232 [Clostridium sp. DL-VIII]
MSRCPFWSTSMEEIECYDECPILSSELMEHRGEKCIFHKCIESRNINIKDIVKEEYDFLDLSIYDENSNNISIGY